MSYSTSSRTGSRSRSRASPDTSSGVYVDPPPTTATFILEAVYPRSMRVVLGNRPRGRSARRRTGEMVAVPLKNIQIVTVHVRDVDAALAFYTDRLGLEKRSDETFGPGYRWVTVAAPGDTAELTLQPMPNAEYDPGQTGIVFAADNVAATAGELEARGVEIMQRPAKQPWGDMMALFRDPDGNVFVLHDAKPA
jgi:predicted enzyme related to lactoylglutathione lyase